MRVSFSQLQKYKECPLSYRYRYVDQIEKITEGREQNKRAWGRALHAGLEAFYKGGSVCDMKSAFHLHYPQTLDDSNQTTTPENGARLLKEYADKRKNDFSVWEFLGVEQEITLSINQVEFLCKIDLVAKHRLTGSIFTWDHKTTQRSLKTDFYSGYDMNDQQTAYVVAARHFYGECSGFYINAIQVGFNQRRSVLHEPGFWWENEMRMWNRLPRQIEDWKRDVSTWVSEINSSRDEDRWGMNTNQCRFCEYLDIELAGWKMPEDKEAIMNLYKERSHANTR